MKLYFKFNRKRIKPHFFIGLIFYLFLNFLWADMPSETGLMGGTYSPGAQMPVTGEFHLWSTTEKPAWNPYGDDVFWGQRMGWSVVPYPGLEIGSTTQINFQKGKDHLWPRLSFRNVLPLSETKDLNFAWGMTDLQEIELPWKKLFFAMNKTWNFENSIAHLEFGGIFLRHTVFPETLFLEKSMRSPVAQARIDWSENHWYAQLENYYYNREHIWSVAGEWRSKSLFDTTQRYNLSMGIRYAPNDLAQGRTSQIGLYSHLTYYPYSDLSKENDGLQTEPILQFSIKPFWENDSKQSLYPQRKGINLRTTIPLWPEQLYAITDLEFADTAHAFEPSPNLWKRSYLQWNWTHNTWNDHGLENPQFLLGALSPNQIGMIWKQEAAWDWWSKPSLSIGFLITNSVGHPYFRTAFGLYPQLKGNSWLKGTKTELIIEKNRQQNSAWSIDHHQNFGQQFSWDLSAGQVSQNNELLPHLWEIKTALVFHLTNFKSNSGRIAFRLDQNLPLAQKWNTQDQFNNYLEQNFESFYHQTPIDWIQSNKGELYQRRALEILKIEELKKQNPVPISTQPTLQEPPIDVKALLKEYENTESEDTDRDGIINDRDNCPTQAEDFNQFEDVDGCPDQSILETLFPKVQ